jgi:hypothetical protein
MKFLKVVVVACGEKNQTKSHFSDIQGNSPAYPPNRTKVLLFPAAKECHPLGRGFSPLVGIGVQENDEDW